MNISTSEGSASWYCMQGDLDLNICEAHAFTTTDKHSLDVFVVNGWQGEVRSLTTSSHR